MYAALAADAEAAVEAELRDQRRRAGYAFAPLTDRERWVVPPCREGFPPRQSSPRRCCHAAPAARSPCRAWLDAHAGAVPRDPPPALLSSLTARMASALGGGGAGLRVKDASLLAPLFESEAGAQRRLAFERLQREAMKRQRVLERQRAVLAGGRGAAAGGGGVGGGGAGGQRQGADAADARALFERLAQGGGGAAADAQPQVGGGGGGGGSSAYAFASRESGGGGVGGVEAATSVASRRRKPALPVRLAGPGAGWAAAVSAAEAFRSGAPPTVAATATADVVAPPLRMHRYEALPAGASLELWRGARGAAPAVLRAWAAAAAADLESAVSRAAAADELRAPPPRPTTGVLEDEKQGGPEPSSRSRYPLDAAGSWGLLLRCGLGGGGGATLKGGGGSDGPAARALAQLLGCLPPPAMLVLEPPAAAAAAAAAPESAGSSRKRRRI